MMHRRDHPHHTQLKRFLELLTDSIRNLKAQMKRIWTLKPSVVPYQSVVLPSRVCHTYPQCP